MKSENIIELRHVMRQYDDNGFIAVHDFNLEVKRGEFVTFLGPSGCGKTTTLRMIAGFDIPTSGEILLNGKSITSLPPYERPINTVFQRYALFPHMNIYDNIAFGLRQKKEPKDVIDRKVKRMLSLVDLEGFEDRSVATLSGGQQQRIAIARALVNEPEILLLDEPLGALDLKMRQEMQIELKAMHDKLGITFIYVTHDQEEALTMSDKIVVMSEGEIQQIGTPEDIYNEPKNAFVADFIGESNILNGCMPQDCLVEFAGKKFECVDKGFGKNETVDVVIRPEDVKVIPAEQAQLTGIVESVVFKGVHYEMTVDCVDRKWLIHSTKAEPVGSVIGMAVDPYDIHIMHKSEQPDAYPALMGGDKHEEA
ncbi:MAG TPA: spermidine/putrescine ABC transporter ATP-binding protein [Oribacterium sp.]|nr:spermidine/putrescine ABC transporter ATP-binding protein [Oribacterium sp.]